MVCLFVRTFSVLLSGQTVVTGKVTDDQTFEPVLFANVIFKGTTFGTKTEFNGNFTLSANTTSDSIVVSFIGYDTRIIGIKHDSIQTLDIHLHPALYILHEVRVTPGENRAEILLRKVWKNKDLNGTDRLSGYQYENYSRSAVFLRKFSDKPDEKRKFRPLSKAFDKFSITTGVENMPALPSYITESISDNFFLRSPKREFTRIKATNSDGIAFENSDLVAQLTAKQENFYFPDNNIPIINKSFVSPLSRFGLLYYKYYLIDSLLIDNRYYCYQIDFKPRREEDPVFHGTMWINDTTYALKRISVTVTEKAELNFIKRLKIQQDYEPSGTGAWFAVRTRFMADAANIFIVNFSQKSNIKVNQPFDQGFYGSDLKVSLNSRDHDQNYWASNRLNSMNRIDSLTWQRIDSLKRISRVRISARLVEASVKGYYNFGKFELGPYLLMYNYNKAEGNRLRIGGRTNISFSRKIVLDGYLAYGFRDRRVKGSVRAEYFLSVERWTKAGLQFRDDIENVGSLDEFYTQNGFLTFASTFGGSDKMDRSRVFRIWLESDILKGLNGKIIFTHKTFRPVSPDYYVSWYTDQSRTATTSYYTISEAALILRYQPGATYVVDGVRRFPVNFNKNPVFTIEYYRGFRGFPDGDFKYRRIAGDIFHSFTIGGLGAIDYDLSYTKIFDQLPYPLLITLAGNQSFFRTNRTFNLMNYGEFVLDRALEAGINYHMNGIILNRIPLLKKLQWRTVLGAHAAFGSFNSSLNGFYDPGENPSGILPDSVGGHPLTRFGTLSFDKPYAELSYGVENILRFLRIDLIQRLTWLENPDANRFAVKISGVFRF